MVHYTYKNKNNARALIVPNFSFRQNVSRLAGTRDEMSFGFFFYLLVRVRMAEQEMILRRHGAVFLKLR